MGQKRFSFQRVFWVTLSVYGFLIMLAIMAMYVSPNIDKALEWKRILHWKYLLTQVIKVLFYAFFYYLSLNLFYRVISERKPTIDYLKPIGISFLLLLGYYALNYVVLKNSRIEININDSKVTEEFTIGLQLFAYIVSAIFIVAFSLGLAYLFYLSDEKKQRKVLEEQKMQLEVEKSQANFNFLKAQINPHFLHNTLNFLYAKSLPYSQELSEGILTLSDIMRYALNEGNTRDGKAPLRDEIEHMRNVIKINQLRFSNNLNVQFDVEGVVNGAQIIPFVLITLVENAFKHGELKSMEHPINILLQVDGHQLFFSCRNRKKTGPKELSTGIGLDNIKKRLDLAYGNQYTFKVKDEAEFYTTELTIDPL